MLPLKQSAQFQTKTNNLVKPSELVPKFFLLNYFFKLLHRKKLAKKFVSVQHCKKILWQPDTYKTTYMSNLFEIAKRLYLFYIQLTSPQLNLNQELIFNRKTYCE